MKKNSRLGLIIFAFFALSGATALGAGIVFSIMHFSSQGLNSPTISQTKNTVSTDLNGSKTSSKKRCKNFAVFINGDGFGPGMHTLSPSAPIKASFCHPDENMQTVRMQNPDNSRHGKNFPINSVLHIKQQEAQMARGQTSRVVFVPATDPNADFNTVILVFKP